MKKLLLTLLAVLLPMMANAEDYDAKINGIYYNFNTAEKTAEVTYKTLTISANSDAYVGNVNIPSEVSYKGVNYTVTRIGDSAFSDCGGLVSVSIPNSVASIGINAFGDCSNLKSITIPDGVTMIEDNTFNGCSSLTSVTIPSSVTSIGDRAFEKCSNLATIPISDNVTSIGTDAFSETAWYNNQPDGLVYAGKVAYKYKGNMPENTIISLQDGTVGIAGEAFYECNNLTAVTIPNTVTNIGQAAFCYCTSLTSVVIPNSVTSIGSSAFMSCSSLTSIVVPSSVTRIGRVAFEGSAWYNNQPDGLVYAGNVAYAYKGNMPWSTTIDIADGTVSIADEAFLGCSGLTSITIPNSVEYIGHAFYGCSGLLSIRIPDGVTSIATFAFQNCSRLKTAVIGKNLSTIGYWIFSNCTELTDIYCMAENVQTQGARGWDYTYLNNITLHVPTASVNTYKTKEPWNNFKEVVAWDGSMPDMPNLSNIKAEINGIYYNLIKRDKVAEVLPNPNPYTGDIVIPEKVTYNGVDYNVTTIGSSAFSNCSSLTSITIPKSVTSIVDFPFIWCSGLTSMKVESGNTVYDSRDNCNAIIETSSNRMIAGCKNTIIPNSVTSIANNTFNGCSDLTSIIIPNSVEYIGDRVFYMCVNLASITISNSVKELGEWAFHACDRLTSITIPDGVTSLGDNIFYGCSNLSSVTIPNSLSTIGTSAFAYCDKLVEVTANWATPIAIEENVFPTRSDVILYVPKGCKGAYSGANYWKNFKEIREFVKDEAATYAVEEEKTLTVKAVAEATEKVVEIPQSVTVNGEDFPVTAIASNAFENNTVIKQVSIPESIEEIGENAFAGCSDLRTIYCHADEPIALPSTEANARTRAGSQESTTNVFAGVDKVICLLYVPVESVSKYKTANGWKDFKYIVGIGTEFIIGNVNGDKVLDEKDLNAIVNHIMGKPQEGKFDVEMADVNKDNDVNVADIVNVNNLIKNQ